MKYTFPDKEKISIKLIIIISFVLIFLMTFIISGYIIFSYWISFSEDTVYENERYLNNEILTQINDFIESPLHVNEVNEKIISNNIVNMEDQKERELYFAGVIFAHDYHALYSFSFGTEDGRYYGARKNLNNQIEIMRNDPTTQGESWYYSTNDDLTTGEISVKAGKFDPRTRDWYKAAKDEGKAVFSKVYIHFYMKDLALSAAKPVYDSQGNIRGVLGAHITMSRINDFLYEIASKMSSSVVIIEKSSGDLIGNSEKAQNFLVEEDGVLSRNNISNINNAHLKSAYSEYINTGVTTSKRSDLEGKHYLNLYEYSRNGLEWLIITDIPESPFSAGILDHVYWALGIFFIALLLAVFLYFKLINIYFKPVENLIKTSEKYSRGEFEVRAKIERNDEIGSLAAAFNSMADTLNILIGNLEDLVKERTDDLKLILDSTVEAIYGIDLEGKCTFCNASCLKLLGYSTQEELLGKDMHEQVHHSYASGEIMTPEECKILRALKENKGVHVENEVFWKADGSFIEVEYNSYPQYKDGKMVGAVVTFIDNSERKRNQEHIKYLSYHDSLTGLYNRMFFEEEMKRLDVERNIPLSIIFLDVNGLKLTNDIFGHSVGDNLLKKAAEILKKVCRQEDIVARVGGDEFAILLPATNKNDAKAIVERIKTEQAKEKVEAIKLSMALGYSTKNDNRDSIESTMKDAEDKMYLEKTMNRKNTNTQLLNTIIETLHERSPREKDHSAAVGELCKNIAQELGLDQNAVWKVKEAGFIHDLGKIVFGKELLDKKEYDFSEEEDREFQQHSVIGYRILNLFDETLDLAEGVLNHHENWDGSGFPKGLKGEEIPLTARIISVAEAYDSMTNEFSPNRKTKEEAVAELESLKGIRFDPKIVEILKKVI